MDAFVILSGIIVFGMIFIARRIANTLIRNLLYLLTAAIFLVLIYIFV